MAGPAAARRRHGDGVTELLAHLGPAAAPDGPLGPALARLDFVAALPNPAAPPYIYFAGSCLGVAVGGGGVTALEAAGRLAGEAAEVLAMAGTRSPESGNDGERSLAALDPAEDRESTVPRNRATSPRDTPAPCGQGVAAGASRAAAYRAGLLELIERDAAARWWNDGVEPRLPDAASLGSAADVLAMVRGTVPKRSTSLLALEGVAGIPVICAVSCDSNGSGLAFGLKAARASATAARGAVIECLQMEIALDLARLRAARGTPGPADAAILKRAALDVAAFPAFLARPAPARYVDTEDVISRLVAAGYQPVAVDLPDAPVGFAVARMLVRGLRRLPGDAPGRPGTPGAHAELM